MDIKEFYTVCINMERRTDRWYESQVEFRKAGIDVTRAIAEEGSNPIEGCGLSHFKILQYCKDIGKHAMIFEDDVKFSNDIVDLQKYLDCLDTVEWDMLYLGANITSPIYPINGLLGQLTSAQSTHAYLVNYNFIPTILACKGLLGKHMDLIYSENIVPFNNCFITIPMLATQRASYSDIEKKVVNYDWMEQRYRNYLEKGIKDGGN